VVGRDGRGPSASLGRPSRGPERRLDVETYFLHDLPAETKADAYRVGAREPSNTPFGQRCEFSRWPAAPIRVVVGSDDRFLPPDLQRRVARERLGIDADEIPGGHLVALVHPVELADRLERYLSEIGRPDSSA
jgi:pimeloyl-ACP methyl ester carboxylesterase